MSGQEAVKRVACPFYRHGMADEGEEGNLIDQETRVVQQGFCELWIFDLYSAYLSQMLCLKQRYWRNAPRTIFIQPGKLLESVCPEDQPNQEMGIEQNRHCFFRDTDTRSWLSPRQSQLH